MQKCTYYPFFFLTFFSFLILRFVGIVSGEAILKQLSQTLILFYNPVNEVHLFKSLNLQCDFCSLTLRSFFIVIIITTLISVPENHRGCLNDAPMCAGITGEKVSHLTLVTTEPQLLTRRYVSSRRTCNFRTQGHKILERFVFSSFFCIPWQRLVIHGL